MHRFGRLVMRHMIGERPWEIAKIGYRYTVKFYPMIKGRSKKSSEFGLFGSPSKGRRSRAPKWTM